MNVKIEKLVYGGEGLGHHEGHTVFVPFVLPEEVVEVRPVETRKKFVRGRVEHVVTPSLQRVAAPCPYFGVCGGCHYQHIPYEAQLGYKVEILRETLGRIGRIAWDDPIPAHPSPPFEYRNRAQWKICPASETRPAAIGYHQAGSTSLCPVEECPVLSPRLAQTLAVLGRLLAQGKLPATLREVEAFADSADANILLNVSMEHFAEQPAALADTLRNELPGVETILLYESRQDRFELFGPGFMDYEVGGIPYRVGHLSFFQVNRFLVDELVRAVLEEEQGELALDLFAGVGLFTIPLARRFSRVVGAEANLAAARDLQANLERSNADPRRAEHANMEIEAFLARWKETPDLVVLDPPRAGVPSAALARLRQIAPARITYLSCNPSTLARDLAALTAEPGGYAIHEIHLFDVFPQTYHIESLIRLRRRA